MKIKQAMLDSIRRTVTEKLAGSDLGPSGYTDSGKFLNSVDKTIEDYRAATPETRASMRESGLLSAPEPYTMAPDTRDLEQTYGIDRGSLTYLPVPGKFDSGYDPINGVVYADTEDSDSSAITAHEVSHAESMGKQSVPRALGEAIPTQLAMMLGGGIPLGALAGYIYKKRFPGNVPSTTRRAVQLALGNPGFMAGHVLQTGTPKGIRNVGIAAALGSLAFLPRLIEETKANTRSAAQTAGFETNDSEALKNKAGDLAISQLSYLFPAAVLAMAAKKGLNLSRAGVTKSLQDAAKGTVLQAPVAAGLRPVFG